MSVHLVYQSRSSDLQSMIRAFQRGKASSLVLSTNVAYSDDAEMRKRLALREGYYQQDDRHDVEFLPATHALRETLLNRSAQITFIDSWNLHVSNLWLRGNSLPKEEVCELIAQEAIDFAQALSIGLNNDITQDYVVLTSDVSMDLQIKTPDLENYLYFITIGNHMLVKALQHQQQAVKAWYSGTVQFQMLSI